MFMPFTLPLTNSFRPLILQSLFSALVFFLFINAPSTAQAANRTQADEHIKHINQGTLAFGKRQYDQAIAHFDKAIGAAPHYALAYLWRGTTYQRQASDAEANSSHIISITQLFEKARRDFESARKFAAPGSLDARDAVRKLKKLAQHRAELPRRLEKRGREALRQGRSQRAEETANALLQLNRKAWDAYILRGDAYRQMGWQVSARQDYEIYLKKAPKGAKAAYAKARIREIGHRPPAPPIQVFWNNQPFSLPIAPLEHGTLLYLPINPIMEKLGARKEYDAYDRKIIYLWGATRLELQMGSSTATLITRDRHTENRRFIFLSRPLFEHHDLKSGHDYATAGLEFFQEALNINVSWLGPQRQVRLTFKTNLN